MRNRAGASEFGRLVAFLIALGHNVRVVVTPTTKRVGEMDVVVGVSAVTLEALSHTCYIA
jgi:hypothetical protein